MFMIVLFLLFATPFCCGIYATVNCLLIPFSLQKSVNSCDVNSPPLSVRRHFMNVPVSFSTWLLKVLYLLLEMGVIGLHTLACTNCRFWEALHVLSFGNGSLCCFPARQSLQILEGDLSGGMSFTIFCCSRIFMPLKPKCPYLQFHNWVESSVIVLKLAVTFDWGWTDKMNILFEDILTSMIKHFSEW